MSEEPKKELKYEMAMQELLRLESEGKLDLTKSIPEKIMIDICAKIEGKRPSVYQALKKILVERSQTKQEPQGVKVEVHPQPKPPIEPQAPEGEELEEKPNLISLDEKLEMGGFFKYIAKGLSFIGIGEGELDNEAEDQLNRLWKPALKQILIEEKPTVINGYVFIGIVVVLSLVVVFASIFLNKPKKDEKGSQEPNLERGK